MAQAAPDPCDIPGANISFGCQAKDKVEDTVSSAADKASTAIEFGKDPFGFIAQKEAEAAQDLTESVIPALSRLTQPDLTQEWFLNAYAISFAAAIFGWVLITLYDVATFRSRGESGKEVIDSLMKWTPIFIGGSMFGPAIGIFLVKGIGFLNAALVDWGISASVGTIVKEFRPLIDEDPSKFLGGSFMAMLVLAGLVLALLLVLVVLVIMMVTLYLSGAVLPLSLMWATKIGQREKGRKVIMVWVGILCSQPLIFLLLGVAFSGAADQMMEVLAESSSDPNDVKLENLVQLLVVIIMLVIATLGPTTLAAYAPVGPTEGAPGGPGVNARGAGKSSGARGGAGPSSTSSSQTSQIAQQNAAQSSSMGAGAGSSGTAAAGTAAGAAATGGTLLAAKAAKDSGEGLADKAHEMKDKGQETAQGAQESSSGQDGESGSNGSGQDGTPGGGSGSGQDGDEGKQGGLAEKAGDGKNGDDGKGGDKGKGGGDGKSGGGLKGAGQTAAKFGGRAVGLAQQAGDFAEEQMDHHRDGARGRR